VRKNGKSYHRKERFNNGKTKTLLAGRFRKRVRKINGGRGEGTDFLENARRKKVWGGPSNKKKVRANPITNGRPGVKRKK